MKSLITSIQSYNTQSIICGAMLYFIFTADLPTKHLTTFIYADVLSIWHSIPTHQLLQVFFKQNQRNNELTTQKFTCSVSPVLFNISHDNTITFMEDGSDCEFKLNEFMLSILL